MFSQSIIKSSISILLSLLIFAFNISIASTKASTLTVSYEPLRSSLCKELSQALMMDNQNYVDSMLCQFESRLQKQKSDKKIEICYAELSNAIADYKSSGDKSIAELCLHACIELADPSQVNQGNHNTCALAALESWLYSKEPELVLQIAFQARSGKITLRDGRTIIISAENSKPDLESRGFRKGAPYRSYLSQLFQVASANIFWQSQNQDPRGIKVKPGTIRYYQDFVRTPMFAGDTRERLIIHWSDNVLEYVAGEGVFPESGPAFKFDAINETYRLISGKASPIQLVAHKEKVSGKLVNKFNSEKDLVKLLSSLKESNSFPAIISISMQRSPLSPAPRLVLANSDKAPIITSQTASGWHAICIDDFDRANGLVMLDNFWGSTSDRLAGNELSLHDLYISSCPPKKKQESVSHAGQLSFKRAAPSQAL